MKIIAVEISLVTILESIHRLQYHLWVSTKILYPRTNRWTLNNHQS